MHSVLLRVEIYCPECMYPGRRTNRPSWLASESMYMYPTQKLPIAPRDPPFGKSTDKESRQMMTMSSFGKSTQVPILNYSEKSEPFMHHFCILGSHSESQY